MYIHYLTIAVRTLLRHKFQSLLSIVGLAVALFCFDLFVNWAYTFYLTDRWMKDHDRIISMKRCDQYSHPSSTGIVSNQFFLDGSMDSIEELESYCRLAWTGGFIHLEQGKEADDSGGQIIFDDGISCEFYEADPTFPQFFSLDILAGSMDDATQSDNSVVLTEQYATRWFGSPEKAIGRQIIIDEVMTVRAVVQNLPPNNSLQNMCNISVVMINERHKYSQLNNAERYVQVYLKAKPQYSREQLIKHISDIDPHRPYEDYDTHEQKTAHYEAYIYNALGGERLIFFLIIFLIAALPGGLVLLAALSNFFHLMVSDIMMHRREYSIRRAHGAHSRSLWQQIFAYILLVLVLTGLLTLILVEVSASFYELDGIKKGIYIDIHQMEWQTMAHLAVLLLVGALVAWITVLRLRTRPIQEQLKSATGSRPGRHIGRNILLCYQLTLAMLFISLLGATYLQIHHNDRTYIPHLTEQQKSDILILKPNGGNTYMSRAQFEQRYDQYLADISDIQERLVSTIALSASSPYYHMPGRVTCLPPSGDSISCNGIFISAAELEFLGFQLEEGRMPQGPDEMVIDLPLMQRHGLSIGDQLGTEAYLMKEVPVAGHPGSYCESWFPEMRYFTIVGYFGEGQGPVMQMQRNDFGPYADPAYPLTESAYFSSTYTEESCYEYWIKCRPGTGPAVADTLRERLKDASYKLRHETYTQVMHNVIMPLSENLHTQNSQLHAITSYGWLMAGITLLLTLLGIYSAVAVDAKARRKEMAIRKINGAKIWQIALCFIRPYTIVLLIATPIAFSLSTLIINAFVENNFQTGISCDFLFFAAIFLLVCLIMVTTVSIQLWRIARVNPAEIVKSE